MRAFHISDISRSVGPLEFETEQDGEEGGKAKGFAMEIASVCAMDCLICGGTARSTMGSSDSSISASEMTELASKATEFASDMTEMESDSKAMRGRGRGEGGGKYSDWRWK